MNIMQCLAIFLLSATVALAQKTIENFDEASSIIKEYVGATKTTKQDLCEKFNCCSINESENCPLSSLEQDQTNLVYPGGETRCIFSSSTPFSFQVIPGSTENIIFYFQGGGACWDEISTDLQFCSTDASPQSLVGIFDRDNDLNAFKDYTIVNVLYCSGDVHGGNTTRPYTDRDGEPVVQVGLYNTQATLDWVLEQQKQGLLADTFKNLIVMGCSAGSIGAQLWGKQVLKSLKFEKAAVVPDSYAGVFPEGSMGPEILDFGFCTSGFLSDDLYDKCMKGELTLQEIDIEFIGTYPSIPYVFVQSKTDIVQQSFYIAIGVTTNSSDMLITPTEFYSDVNDIFGDYNQKLGNFMTYLVDGLQHCFTNQNLYYTADPKGPMDDNASGEEPMLYDYLNNLPLENGDDFYTVCEGDLQGGLQVEVEAEDNTYCSKDVYPKSFTEKY